MSAFFHLWWPDWASFLRMGLPGHRGYGVYVWGSVAAVALALAGEQLALRRRARRVRRAQLAAQEQAP